MMAIRTAKEHARQFSKFKPLRHRHTEHTGSELAHLRHRLEPGARERLPQSRHIGRFHAGILLTTILPVPPMGEVQ